MVNKSQSVVFKTPHGPTNFAVILKPPPADIQDLYSQIICKADCAILTCAKQMDLD